MSLSKIRTQYFVPGSEKARRMARRLNGYDHSFCSSGVYYDIYYSPCSVFVWIIVFVFFSVCCFVFKVGVVARSKDDIKNIDPRYGTISFIYFLSYKTTVCCSNGGRQEFLYASGRVVGSSRCPRTRRVESGGAERESCVWQRPYWSRQAVRLCAAVAVERASRVRFVIDKRWQRKGQPVRYLPLPHPENETLPRG